MKTASDPLLVLHPRQLVTPLGSAGLRGAAAGDLTILEDGGVAIAEGKIVAVASSTELRERYPGAEMVDLGGRGALTPGLVDPHTHAVFGGHRVGEFEERLRGKSYVEISKAGGGILSSVRETRKLTMEELADGSRHRLREMRRTGTTTVEIKSGYALEVGAETRMLGAIDILAMEEPMTVVPTFMGAHEVPPEYRDGQNGGKARYVDVLCEEMIPAAAEQGIAKFCDVFCEDHVFTVEESRRICERAKEVGLIPKVHADELEPLGGAELAAEVGAVSADHLGCVSAQGVQALAASETVAVLLPGTTFFLDLPQRAPARDLLDAGAIVAIATDCNPGSCTTTNLPLVMSLACIQLKMLPAEALTAATLNAAAAIGLAATKGSLEPGKDADLVHWSCDDYRDIAYRYGVPQVERVWHAGHGVE